MPEKILYHKLLFSKAIIWLIFMLVLLITVELFSRTIGHYHLFSLQLKKNTNFSQLDKLVIWNQWFIEKRKKEFADWPIPLETFNDSESNLPFLPKPNQKWAKKDHELIPLTNGQRVFWSTNSWGFRGKEFSVQKQSGTLRIITLGASTTVDPFNFDDETYPFYLEQKLKSKSYKVEVINGGLHGQKINNLIALFEKRILPLKPDIVIFYEATNNIEPLEWVKKACSNWFSLQNGYPCWYQNMWQHSAFLKSLFKLFGLEKKRITTSESNFLKDSPKPSIITYQQNIRKFIQESKKKVINQ